jgi:translation initiation factor IF-2
MMKRSWESPEYRLVGSNEGMANWQEPTPMYNKAREQVAITILANKQSRIPKRKLNLDQMMDEVLQEKEQALRQEFEQKIKNLEEENQRADISQAEYIRLQKIMRSSSQQKDKR